MGIIHIIIAIYVIGLACYTAKSLFLINQVYGAKRVSITLNTKAAAALLKIGLRRYLFYKTVFWPYYLLIETNPLDIISTTLFKDYGEPSVTSLGTDGLKNFLNDVFRGKHRYRYYEVKTFTIICSPGQKIYKEYLHYLPERTTALYAEVIVAKHTKMPDRYLVVHILHAERESTNQPVANRYDLDRCRRVTLQQLHAYLRDINPDAISAVLDGENLQK